MRLFYFVICFIVFFSLSKWSTVAFPFCPPACASVILILGVILLFIILSNSLPKLLARVIPLSLDCEIVRFHLANRVYCLENRLCRLHLIFQFSCRLDQC